MVEINTSLKVQMVILVFLLVLPVFYSGAALADDRGNAGDHRVAVDRHVHHYYRNGHWYRHGWFGVGVAEPTLATGVYVDTLPPAYTPVVVQGATYYYGDNTYFSALPQGGYTVVTAPSR